uniref:Uncharacterized protein n=1 Tax=Arundo donax TaxID=35708 RepID=A0A0A9BIB5_ARUDO
MASLAPNLSRHQARYSSHPSSPLIPFCFLFFNYLTPLV